MKFLFLTLLILSCGTIEKTGESPKVQMENENLGDSFLYRIRKVKNLIKEKNYDFAQSEAISIVDADLNETEKTEKYNILGLVYYYQEKYQIAKTSFMKALKFRTENSKVQSQTILNLASTFYRIGEFERGIRTLKKIDPIALPDKDLKKVYLLRFHLAKKLSRTDDKIYALVKLLSQEKNRDTLLSHKYFTYLRSDFLQLPFKRKMNVFTKFSGDRKTLVVQELYDLTIAQLGKSSNKDQLLNFQSWYQSNIREKKAAIADEEKEYVYEVSKEIDPKKIGVILPLTGSKGNFGQKVLSGLNLALGTSLSGHSIIVRDSVNEVSKIESIIEELVKTENVSAIIGGLFNTTSEQEYKLCKKYGVVYISLSPVQIDRNEKDHLLVEVPGSIESQVKALFTPLVARKLGKRFGLMFPQSDLGESYLDEIWERSQREDFELTSISGFERNQNDHRVAIGNLVGVKFSRKREDELRNLQKEYKKENKDLSEIKLMKPIVEFDWVFIPSYPKQALQILPSFKYLGVKNIAFVGGPSWRSRSLLSRREYLGKVYFVEDLNESKKMEFINMYRAKYNKEPKLLESLGFDSIHILKSIFAQSNFVDREELFESLRLQTNISGFLGNWVYDRNLWLKTMQLTDLNSIGN